VHEDIDNEALKDIGFSDEALERINTINSLQDILHLFEPECHGDRTTTVTAEDDKAPHKDAFKALKEYIAKQKALFLELLGETPHENYTGALDAMGRALHGIQDFYAHSNYVELNPDEQEQAKKALNCEAEPPNNLKMTGWGTGPDDEYPHDDNNVSEGKNKDPEGQEGFEEAKDAATEHTKESVEDWKEQLEQKLKEKYGEEEGREKFEKKWNELRNWKPTTIDEKFLQELKQLYDRFRELFGLLRMLYEKLTEELKDLFGANESINTYVITPEDKELVVGVQIRDRKVVALRAGGVPDPTINIYITLETLRRIVYSPKPALAFQMALDEGKVRYERIVSEKSIPRFGFTGQAGYMFPDNALKISEGSAFGLQSAINLIGGLALEGSGSYHSDLSYAGGGLCYSPELRIRWSPYLAVGTSYIDLGGEFSQRRWGLNAGLGIRCRLSDSLSLSVQAADLIFRPTLFKIDTTKGPKGELIQRKIEFEETTHNWVITAGMNWSLKSKKKKKKETEIDEKYFRDKYNKDKENQKKQKWNGSKKQKCKGYLSWVKKFLHGRKVSWKDKAKMAIASVKDLIPYMEKGWLKTMREIIDSLSKASAEDKERLRKKAKALGKKIAGEWAKDNDVRKIDSKNDLKKWFKKLSDAKKRDEGDGKEVEKALDEIENEVDEKLKNKDSEKEREDEDSKKEGNEGDEKEEENKDGEKEREDEDSKKEGNEGDEKE